MVLRLQKDRSTPSTRVGKMDSPEDKATDEQSFCGSNGLKNG